ALQRIAAADRAKTQSLEPFPAAGTRPLRVMSALIVLAMQVLGSAQQRRVFATRHHRARLGSACLSYEITQLKSEWKGATSASCRSYGRRSSHAAHESGLGVAAPNTLEQRYADRPAAQPRHMAEADQSGETHEPNDARQIPIKRTRQRAHHDHIPESCRPD